MNYSETDYFKYLPLRDSSNSNTETYNTIVGLDLLNISPVQKAELTEKVKAANGTVRLFVHPYYRVQSAIRDFSPRNPAYISSMVSRDKKNLDIFEKCIGSCSANTPPIIVLESGYWLNSTKSRLDQLAGQQYYTVTTINGDAALLNNEQTLIGPPESHKQIYEILEDIETKRVIIGGHYLEFKLKNNYKQFDLDNTKLYLNGEAYNNYIPMRLCAGYTIWGFLETDKFDVVISNCSYPNGIKQLKKILTKKSGNQL